MGDETIGGYVCDAEQMPIVSPTSPLTSEAHLEAANEAVEAVEAVEVDRSSDAGLQVLL